MHRILTIPIVANNRSHDGDACASVRPLPGDDLVDVTALPVPATLKKRLDENRFFHLKTPLFQPKSLLGPSLALQRRTNEWHG